MHALIASSWFWIVENGVAVAPAGFGASGRNGGFQSAGMAGEARVFSRDGGMDAVRRAERAFMDGIDWVGAVVAEEGIDCGWHKGGAWAARTQWQAPRGSGNCPHFYDGILAANRAKVES